MGDHNHLLIDGYIFSAATVLTPNQDSVLKGLLINAGTFNVTKTKGVGITFEQSDDNSGLLERITEEFPGMVTPTRRVNRKPDPRTGNTYYSSRLSITPTPLLTPIYEE
jgi:hypothetical protein